MSSAATATQMRCMSSTTCDCMTRQRSLEATQDVGCIAVLFERVILGIRSAFMSCEPVPSSINFARPVHITSTSEGLGSRRMADRPKDRW
eukprot:3618778-Amphidinium_carterae.1